MSVSLGFPPRLVYVRGSRSIRRLRSLAGASGDLSRHQDRSGLVRSIRNISSRPAYTMSTSTEKTPGTATATINGKKEARNAWASPGPAAFDFRSDTATCPSTAMLAAISSTTLLDDVVQEDTTTTDLESWIASLLPTRHGPSHGLLVLSGTMGNQVCLRALLNAPPHSVLGDARSHIFQAEAGALCLLSQAYPLSVEPANGHHLTLKDVSRAAVLDTNVHHTPTRLIALENTLHGGVMPLEEVRAISHWAAENDIAVHLDGARLWDAAVWLSSRSEGTMSLKEALAAYSSLVDSVTVCFSKGLGAPVGSLVASSPGVITRARHFRKLIGGGMRMTGVLAAPARVAVETTFFGGLMARAHALAARLGSEWTSKGGVLKAPVETGMLWLDVLASGIVPGALEAAVKAENDDAGKKGDEERVQGYFGGEVVRIACHYQIEDRAVERLVRAFGRALEGRDANRVAENRNGSGGGVGGGFAYGEERKG